MAERVKPGMTEGEVFGIVHEAVLREGGEMGMIQLASAPMLDPDLERPAAQARESYRRRPRHHQQRAGDFLQRV